ncbi:MAG TPA: hypothetical protein VG276_30900 [Actinomycetes bacterium]|nr:hypothetical protein [Actinomycetes bacterium]
MSRWTGGDPDGAMRMRLFVLDVTRAARITRRCVTEARALRLPVPPTVEHGADGLVSWADELGGRP